MKRLWVKYLSLLLILAQTSVLFADTLTFNNGQKINGKLISISEEQVDEFYEFCIATGIIEETIIKSNNEATQQIELAIKDSYKRLFFKENCQSSKKA